MLRRDAVVTLVPDEHGETALLGLNGVRAIRYQGVDGLAAIKHRVDVLVPGFRPDDEITALLGKLPGLRLVQLRSAGAERWVSRMPAGVALSDCRGAHSAITAEWVVTALLASLREMPSFAINQAAGIWERLPTDSLIGKRVLLLGSGDVAEHVVRRLSGFDLKEVTRVARVGRPGIYSTSELPHLLPRQDIVIVLIPLTPETDRLVGKSFLAAMRDNATLINAARGRVVDTEALLSELNNRRLRAVLDVVDPDPLPPTHPLWAAPGVLITPHVAGIDTRDRWRARAYAVVRQQLHFVVRGEEPPNLVTGDY